MALAFPNNPSPGQIFTSGNDSWYWTGTYWEVQPVTSPTFDDVATSGNADIGGNAEITGTLNVTGATTLADLSVTGTVTGVASALDDLSDVNASSPTNGQVLQYNTDAEEWRSASLSSTFIGGNVPNATNFQNNTSSTTSATGAVKVTGGLGVGENINASGYIATTATVRLKTNGVLRFNDSDDTNYVGLKGPTSVGTNITWTLPDSDGSSGQFLRTNGSGVLSWASAAGAGGGTPPGGSDTQVQFNDNNSFGGSSNFTFDSGTNELSVSIVSITENTVSSSTTTGALKITGGAGIAGQLNVGGATSKFTASTASTSTTTGSVVVTGGVGIGGEINVGSTVSTSTAPTETDHLTNKQYVDQQISAFSIAFGV